MNELTIQQAIEYLDISYPTALDLAQRVGRLDCTERKSGVWKIPADHVLGMLKSQLDEIEARLGRLRKVIPAT